MIPLIPDFMDNSSHLCDALVLKKTAS